MAYRSHAWGRGSVRSSRVQRIIFRVTSWTLVFSFVYSPVAPVLAQEAEQGAGAVVVPGTTDGLTPSAPEATSPDTVIPDTAPVDPVRRQRL